MESINNFISAILSDKKICNVYCNDIDDGAEYLQNIHNDLIKEELLLKLINMSSHSSNYSGFLSDLSICLKKEEVTPLVFDKFISLKGKYRNSILSGLGHCPLSYYQLMKLNELHIDEALTQLLIIHMESDCFSNYDIIKLLEPWKNKTPKFVTQYICKLYQNTEKGQFFQSLLG